MATKDTPTASPEREPDSRMIFVVVEGLDDWAYPVPVGGCPNEEFANAMRDALQAEFRDDAPALKFTCVEPGTPAELLALMSKWQGASTEFGEQVKDVCRASDRLHNMLAGVFGDPFGADAPAPAAVIPACSRAARGRPEERQASMEPPLLVLIDRVCKAVKAFIDAAEAEWEKAQAEWAKVGPEWPTGQAEYAKAQAEWAEKTEATAKAAVDAFGALLAQRRRTATIEGELNLLDYDDAETVNPEWLSESGGDARVGLKRGQFGFNPIFVDLVRQIEQALLKARSFCSDAQERLRGMTAAAGSFGQDSTIEIPVAPSTLAELPEWIRKVRELLRGQEDQPIEQASIAFVVRKHFLECVERLFPADWPAWHQHFQPQKFHAVRDLVAMMAWVGQGIAKSPPQFPVVEGFAAGSGKEAAGVAPRNDKFLEWYEAVDTETYHKPAKIRRKWNDMPLKDRQAVCPDHPEIVTQATAVGGVKEARKRRKQALEQGRK